MESKHDESKDKRELGMLYFIKSRTWNELKCLIAFKKNLKTHYRDEILFKD